MPRPFNRRQALENHAFLAALARTGNARLAARELGVHRSTFTKRRAKDAAFAAEWDAALALAHATLENPPSFTGEVSAQRTEGANPPRSRSGRGTPRAPGGGEANPPRACSGRGTAAAGGGGGAAPPHRLAMGRGTARAAGGGGAALEPRVIRLANGRLQLRAPPRGARRIGQAARQAFLAALAATANVRLSARAAGFAHSSFYRLRDHDPAFAREMRMALETGYERIELALLESFDPESFRDDAWRRNDLPPIPPMTAGEALQLLHLHQKEARLRVERPDRRRRRGEDTAAYSKRLARKWRAEKAWDREGYEVARALRREGGAVPAHLEPAPPALPALEQVTGWSGADPAKPLHHPGRALFGGWRLKDRKGR